MVMRATGTAKSLPEGTTVRFTQGDVDQDVQRGDEGVLKVVKTQLPRGRGITYQYFVVFDDGVEVEVGPRTHFYVSQEAPEISQKRSRLYTDIRQRVRRLVMGDPNKPRKARTPTSEGIKKFLFEGPSLLQEKQIEDRTRQQPSNAGKPKPSPESNKAFWLGKGW